MPVTTEIANFLAVIEAAAAPRPDGEQTPDEVRAEYAMLLSINTKEEVAAVVDRDIPGPDGPLPVRVYTPADAGGEAGPAAAAAGVLVYFHGGGWSIGSIETHDAECRSLANGAGVVVVSVEYRLGPEHSFPAAYDDALAAVRWVAGNAAELGADGDRLAVGGDSAGGNLSAVVCQALRDSGPAIRFQLLVYPVTDITLTHPSVDENGEGYFLTKEIMEWFRANYLAGALDEQDPRVSPLRAAPEALSGLPPALVITAQYDPLRDEGDAYAEALRAAGVDVTHAPYDGMIHGFFSMRDFVPEGKVAMHQACEALAQALS